MSTCPTPWKPAYDSKPAAAASIRHTAAKGGLRRRRRDPGVAGQIIAYRCSCGAWHTGHAKPAPLGTR